MKYGDSVDCSWKDAALTYATILRDNTELNIGDSVQFNKVDQMMFTPVIVRNDANFLDVEYRFKFNKKVYTFEETKQIMKAIKKS